LSKAKRVISDRISAIRKQGKAYTESTEDAEFAEKSGSEKPKSTDPSRLRVNKSVCAACWEEKRDGNTEITEVGTQRSQRKAREKR
jgi:hypothetical protein